MMKGSYVLLMNVMETTIKLFQFAKEEELFGKDRKLCLNLLICDEKILNADKFKYLCSTLKETMKCFLCCNSNEIK